MPYDNLDNRIDPDCIVRNAIRTPDGTVLESKSHYDYQSYVDANGKTYMVDGGREMYTRRSIHDDQEDLTVYYSAGHEVCRELITWGTYGINGDQPLKHVTVAEMDTAHLETVVKLPRISPIIKQVMLDELEMRNV